MKGFSYESRSLKRPRLGPPDVYPQEAKQKEDELTVTNVKLGFTAYKLEDEFGTARNCNVTASKVGAFFNAILGKKDEINTLLDSGRKRQQINPKDNFWPATGRTKTAVEAWFKDLSGNKALLSLSKKAPNFNKKEDIYPLLCDFQVPMLRAAWFIKLSSAYTVAVTEAKGKKRQLPDPTQEWTASVLKFLKEHLNKLQEFYQSTTQTVMTEDQKASLKLWHYTTQLTRYLYQEGLLDRQEMLQWILEQLEKYKNWPPAEDGPLRLILPVVIQYLEEFVQNELLARKLAYICMGRLAQLCNNQTGGVSPNSPNHNAVSTTQNNGNNNSAAAVLNEYLNCAHHKDVVLSLSVVIEVITLECPTALVWNSIGEGKSASMLNGSPLDILLCSPSQLPMPKRNSNQHIRNQLRNAEEMIKERSLAAENKWSCDKWQQSCAGVTTQRVLTALDALDRHSFHKVDTNNSLETLYQKIFPVPPEKNQYQVEKDEQIVNLLCWWAVSGNRYGEHRAIAVAKLLERRNNQVQQGQDSDMTDDKDSVNSATPGLPVFQPLLMKFLDNDAPILEDNSTSSSNRTMFTNLVHLFSELIRHDVFSHDAYMCTLISRGDLLQVNAHPGVANNETTPRPSSNKPLETPTTQMYLDSDPTALFDLKPNKLQEHGRPMECDDSQNIDNQLEELLEHIKGNNSMNAPDSPKDVSSSLVSGGMSNINAEGDINTESCGKPSRHLLYTTHFPLPQDESCSHECNQRHVLLYGVGRVRDEARHTVKRTAKDICKLFSKKFSIDVAEGGKVKKHSRNEFNFESTTARVQNLSFFDQHVVTWQCSMTVYEMISSFASGNSNYLPVQEHVAFLFDLMELSFNIYGLIDICIQILKEIPEVEAQLDAKGSNLVKTYTTGLVLYIVGVLRRYHCCLLLSGDQTVAVFEGLCRVVKHISNPGDCSSAERCVLSHLYDLYASCNLLKTRPHSAEPFSNAYPKIRAALYSSLTPSQSGNQVTTPFLADVIKSVRKGMKIEMSWYRQLNDSSVNRYSFVCNTIVAVCSTNDVDRLNDLGHLSAELTAHCNLLSAEWLGVLTVLCYTSNSPSYAEILSHVDIHELSIHNSLAVFTSILVARHCFSLEDFVVHVALPSLLTVCNEVRGDADLDAEAGARLTCHLLLRLFKTSEVPQPAMYSVGTSPHPLPVNSASSIKLSCDRHLLAAAHNNIKVGPVLAVLKAILVVGDATAGRGSRGKVKPHKMTPPSGQSELSISHILGTSDCLGGARDDLLLELGGGSSISSNGGLSELAQLVLKEMCSEEWILERCLQRPEDLCTHEMMLDSMLTAKQAQRLLHMICYPDNPVNSDGNLDQKTIIANILENLELWTLRVSWLDMQLMLKQYTSNTQELNLWLETVAKAAINLFNLTPANSDFNIFREESGKGKNSMWLVAPLVAKLPSTVQGRVLKVAGQVLEAGNWFTSGTKSKGAAKAASGPQMGHHQPFLALVLTCLKGQDDQREGLLTSLHTQLTQCLQIVKEDRNYICENHKSRNAMQDALLLRFSLIGGMFDTIQRNTTLTTDWAILLVQLVIYGVIDLNNNSELFNTVMDMLATLIHSTLVSDSQSEKCEENRKHYQNLMKKLKKEVGERNSPSIMYIKQLLPLSKKLTDIIACSPSGLVTDMIGNKIAFDSNDKHGLQVVEKQRMNPWDILEGQKNLAPLSWPWFGAIRVERKLLPSEETHRLLQCHTHSLVKSSDYYLEPLPLPPEDIDPPKPMKGGPGMHENTPPSVDSPRGGKRHLGKQALNTRKKKQSAKPGTPVMQHVQQGGPPQAQMGQMVGPYQNQNQAGMFPGAPQPPQWGGAPPYQQQVHPQQAYYPQQPMQQPNPGNPGRVNQSKQALSNMLRMRMPPSSQYMAQPQPPMQNFQPMPRQTMFRQQMQGMQGGMQGASQSGQMFPQQQQQMYQNMQQQGMNQNYGGYGGGGMVSNAGMFPDQTMMRNPEYQQRIRAPYMQQAPNVTMSSMGGPLSQNQPAPPYTRPGAPQQQQAPQGSQHFTQQQMNQQRIRQQLMAMQHQNQQQQQNSTAIVAQLQRQMHTGNQQQQQQQHMYQQPPPY